MALHPQEISSVTLKIALILVLSIQSVVSSCDEGWVEFNGFCFGFSEDIVDWYTASALCNVYGGRQVQIESQAKQDWLASQLKARNILDAWIGATNRYHKNLWEWVPSSKPVKAYANLATGQPDNNQGENPIKTGYYEQCLQFWGSDSYKWHDRWCAIKLYFICEKKAKQYDK